MDAQKVDMFIMSNGKFFESHHINDIRERLIALDESKWAILSTTQFKDPTTTIIVSLLAGGLGIDRFMIGLKDVIPDEKVRYKTIVEECLYFSDINTTNIFICKCGKEYKHRQSLFTHKKQCNTEEQELHKTNEPTDKELMMMVIQQNAELMKKNDELQNMMMVMAELQEQFQI